MPLVIDEPKHFGVKQFCGVCGRCSDGCPVKAIASGPPTAEVYSQSNIKGVRKWTTDAEKCFSYWVAQNSDCSICIRVCPYNKLPETALGRLYFRVWKRLAGSPLRRFALWLDNALGFGKRLKPEWWWKNRPGW